MIKTTATHAAAAARAATGSRLDMSRATGTLFFFSVLLFYYTNVYLSCIETLMAATSAAAAATAVAESSGLRYDTSRAACIFIYLHILIFI